MSSQCVNNLYSHYYIVPIFLYYSIFPHRLLIFCRYVTYHRITA